MSAETHSQLANFIWSICNLLRGPYKRNEYRKVILPFTVLRRFDCILAPTKTAVLKEHATTKAKPENIIRHKLSQITGHAFYNLSKLDLPRLLDDPNQLAPNLNSYINGFSPNVRAIMERFDFGTQIARMADKDLLYLVIKKFATIDLSPARVDNVQMGYVFEELIRIGAEQSNEEAGEHFTPREVIKLMVNLLLSPEKDLARSHVVKTIYDPACGTGGMLSVAEKDPDHIGELTKIFGNFRDGQTRTFTEEDPITHQPVQRQRVVSKIFDNEDFGYHKITVERPLRLNFQANADRIARLDEESGFKSLATSAKKDPAVRQQEIEAGQQRQEEIRAFLRTLGGKLFKDREAFLSHLRKSASSAVEPLRLSAAELKAVLAALGERDETADICRLPAPSGARQAGDRDGQPEPDADLRDTETVPLKESIEEYFKREVLPHVPDAWIDDTKTKVGYEIPLNRHFYRYEPPRPLEVIETDIKRLEGEILAMLKEVTA